MNMVRCLSVSLVVCGAVVVATQRPAAAATVVDLGSLAGSSGTSHAYGINDGGTVVGTSSTSGGGLRAVMWGSNHRIVALPVPAGTINSVALSVNNSGVAVGWSDDSAGRTHALKWTGATAVTDLAPNTSGNNAALDINNRGEVVGYSTSSGLRRAVRFSGGGVVNVLPASEQLGSSASAISDLVTGTNRVLGSHGANQPFEQGSAPAGTAFEVLPGPNGTSYSSVAGSSANGTLAVGTYRISTGPQHAATWMAVGSPPTSWTFRDLGALGGPRSFGRDTNPAGTIVVGSSDRASGAAHAFRWQSGTGMCDLGALTASASCASDAQTSNGNGAIVGASCTANSAEHAVLWT